MITESDINRLKCLHEYNAEKSVDHAAFLLAHKSELFDV
jgi:hypothetical protein